jgi:hypothetical protein
VNIPIVIASKNAGIIYLRTGAVDRLTINGATGLVSIANDLTARGYIFQVDGNRTAYPTTGGKYIWDQQPIPPKFLVGAPFQFYFGPVKGASALDRFKTKYSVDE